MNKITSLVLVGVAFLLGGCGGAPPEDLPDPVKGTVVGAYQYEETYPVPMSGTVHLVTKEHYILILDLDGDGQGDRLVEVREDLWNEVSVGDVYQRTNVSNNQD